MRPCSRIESIGGHRILGGRRAADRIFCCKLLRTALLCLYFGRTHAGGFGTLKSCGLPTPFDFVSSAAFDDCCISFLQHLQQQRRPVQMRIPPPMSAPSANPTIAFMCSTFWCDLQVSSFEQDLLKEQPSVTSLQQQRGRSIIHP